MLYLDASVLVPMFTTEPSSLVVIDMVEGAAVTISDFAAGEFAAAVSRKVREGRTREKVALDALGFFDEWLANVAFPVPLTSSDVARAAAFVRRFELKLRMPDALHIAIAEAHGATLVTRDKLMTDAAEASGLAVLRLD